MTCASDSDDSIVITYERLVSADNGPIFVPGPDDERISSDEDSDCLIIEEVRPNASPRSKRDVSLLSLFGVSLWETIVLVIHQNMAKYPIVPKPRPGQYERVGSADQGCPNGSIRVKVRPTNL